MHTTKRMIRARAQSGVVAVEFGMLALVFFTVVFGTLEVARAMYLWSMVIESTQRAARGAANAGFDASTLDQVRNKAMFSQADGLFMGGNLRPAHLRIDYLNSQLASVTPQPTCAHQPIVTCSADINGTNCIRFVRARLCANDGNATCTRVDYAPLFGGNFFPAGIMKFPTFTTITPAGLFGHQPGASSCP